MGVRAGEAGARVVVRTGRGGLEAGVMGWGGASRGYCRRQWVWRGVEMGCWLGQRGGDEGRIVGGGDCGARFVRAPRKWRTGRILDGCGEWMPAERLLRCRVETSTRDVESRLRGSRDFSGGPMMCTMGAL